jgi:hypothetical protein
MGTFIDRVKPSKLNKALMLTTKGMDDNLKMTPDFIFELEPNEVFVFGSNSRGSHGAGAALHAKEEFGAEEGVGEGMTGQCYAFPTLDGDYSQRSPEELTTSRDILYKCCEANPDKVFLLTEVGCGIAGFSYLFMRTLFHASPPNLIKPMAFTMGQVSANELQLQSFVQYCHYYPEQRFW